MLQLKQHDLSILCEARKDSEQVANMVNLAATGGASARALEANSEAFGNIQGFALALDFYYTSNNAKTQHLEQDNRCLSRQPPSALLPSTAVPNLST
ncbi:hypothetical protein INR49_016210 [Caranx melampygus]|nr:hypothetical protein INR49_016210 [Caranx melampygus]